MKRLTIGILAHVDSGKTTLSEGLLYCAGMLRKLGRVDHGDAFLDTHALEKSRGITIFSKQARLLYGDCEFTLLDTPGHVDFSAETERTLSVLDYALLVVSGHTAPYRDAVQAALPVQRAHLCIYKQNGYSPPQPSGAHGRA